jgi:hypothetical protein
VLHDAVRECVHADALDPYPAGGGGKGTNGGRRLLPPERRGQRRRDAIGVRWGKDGSKFKDEGRRGAFWISEAFESWKWWESVLELPLGGAEIFPLQYSFLSAMPGHEIIRGLMHNRPA